MNNEKKILVTGARGFIGSHLLSALEENFQVIATPSSKELDIRDKEGVFKLPPAHTVIHLAGTSNVPISWKDPGNAIFVNTIGTVNILEYCKKFGAKLIIPSSYPYGNPQYLPTDEDHPTKAENPYAVSKLAVESLCHVYHTRYGLDITILRIFNVYGPGQSEQMIVPKMILDLKNNKRIEVQTGKPKRDMIFVSDVIEALMSCLDRRGFEIYNVGSGNSYSIKELAKKLIEISGRKYPFKDKHNPRPNDIMETRADISKIQKYLGWRPKVDIDEGLTITYSRFLK